MHKVMSPARLTTKILTLFATKKIGVAGPNVVYHVTLSQSIRRFRANPGLTLNTTDSAPSISISKAKYFLHNNRLDRFHSNCSNYILSLSIGLSTCLATSLQSLYLTSESTRLVSCDHTPACKIVTRFEYFSKLRLSNS